MTDADLAIRAILMGYTGLTSLVGNRVYASTDLPAGYTPDDGPAVLFNVRGGQGPDESGLITWPSYQFRSYAATEAEAREVDRAVYGALNFTSSNRVKMARLDVYPQLLRQPEPEPQWPFVLSFYRAIIANP